MTVAFIVFMLSFPVYLVGISAKSFKLAVATAIVMAFIAANTGSPDYFLIDLVGIGVALYLVFDKLKED